jgi:hypothetical protein
VAKVYPHATLKEKGKIGKIYFNGREFFMILFVTLNYKENSIKN